MAGARGLRLEKWPCSASWVGICGGACGIHADRNGSDAGAGRSARCCPRWCGWCRPAWRSTAGTALRDAGRLCAGCCGSWPTGGLASFAAEVLLGVVGEQPRHGGQDASCRQLLPHAALALPMEGLQPHHALDDLVHLLHSAAVLIDVGEGLHRIAPAVQQCGHQGVLGVAGRALDQPRAPGAQVDLRLLVRALSLGQIVTISSVRCPSAKSATRALALDFSRKTECSLRSTWVCNSWKEPVKEILLKPIHPTGAPSSTARPAHCSTSRSNARFSRRIRVGIVDFKVFWSRSRKSDRRGSVSVRAVRESGRRRGAGKVGKKSFLKRRTLDMSLWQAVKYAVGSPAGRDAERRRPQWTGGG